MVSVRAAAAGAEEAALASGGVLAGARADALPARGVEVRAAAGRAERLDARVVSADRAAALAVVHRAATLAHHGGGRVQARQPARLFARMRVHLFLARDTIFPLEFKSLNTHRVSFVRSFVRSSSSPKSYVVVVVVALCWAVASRSRFVFPQRERALERERDENRKETRCGRTAQSRRQPRCRRATRPATGTRRRRRRRPRRPRPRRPRRRRSTAQTASRPASCSARRATALRARQRRARHSRRRRPRCPPVTRRRP